jgi:hypothetical protein
MLLPWFFRYPTAKVVVVGIRIGQTAADWGQCSGVGEAQRVKGFVTINIPMPSDGTGGDVGCPFAGAWVSGLPGLGLPGPLRELVVGLSSWVWAPFEVIVVGAEFDMFHHATLASRLD